jgi:hypothetical protein
MTDKIREATLCPVGDCRGDGKAVVQIAVDEYASMYCACAAGVQLAKEHGVFEVTTNAF